MNFTEMIESTPKTNLPPTHTRKAVVWGQENLLVEAVELFLEASSTWDVVRISSEEGGEYLVQEVTRINPDVVILCADRTIDDPVLPLQLIDEQLDLRVIALELESNRVQVYSKQNFVIKGVSDLLSIVADSNFSGYTPGKEVGLEK